MTAYMIQSQGLNDSVIGIAALQPSLHPSWATARSEAYQILERLCKKLLNHGPVTVDYKTLSLEPPTRDAPASIAGIISQNGLLCHTIRIVRVVSVDDL